jgi:hypothetical protein
MILTNTVSSSVTLNSATSTVSTPADEQAPRGFMPGSNGESWVALPGPICVINALGQLTTAGATLDCSQYGYFSFTSYGGAQAITISNAVIGQVIKIRNTGTGSATFTYPGSTITWIGVAANGTCSSSAPGMAAATTDITLVCTAAGTYDGLYVIS